MRTMFFKRPSVSQFLMRALAGIVCYVAFAAMLLSPAQSSAQTLADFIQLGRTRTGSVQYDGATAGGESYTIVGGGQDIWNRQDECAFAYHEIHGDFDVKVRVTELQPSGQWSKAG